MPIAKNICAYNAQIKLPPLENLRVFEAIARLQGFTAAAESLVLSHSAVSRRVSELEALLRAQPAASSAEACFLEWRQAATADTLARAHGLCRT